VPTSTQNNATPNTADTSKPLASAEIPATSAPAPADATDGAEKESGPCGLPKGCVIL
jgi:hypothetical protein